MYRYFHLPVILFEINVEVHIAREIMENRIVIHTNTLQFHRQM